jgi:hypothetical protein
MGTCEALTTFVICAKAASGIGWHAVDRAVPE